jgi:hypothetical protein
MRPDGAAPRVVYHAMGGGHGHVLRGIAVVSRLGFGTVVGPPRLAPWAEACGVPFVGLDDPHEAASLPAPDLLLVDVFPRGVVAELAPVLGRAPAWLVTRRVPPAYYLHPPVREAIETRFERVLWTEEPPPELTALGVAAERISPVVLRHAPLSRDAARADLGVGGEPLVLALGSGPVELQALQRRMLTKVAARVGATLRFVSDALEGAVRRFPAARWLPAADAVVSAGGYHAFHEIAASGVPAAFLPQERPLDDQAWRVREFPAPASPQDLEDVVARQLRAGRRTGRAFDDGAEWIANRVRRHVRRAPAGR